MRSRYYFPVGKDKRRLGRFIRRTLVNLSATGEVRTHAEKLWAADIFRMLQSGQGVDVQVYDSVIKLRPFGK